MVKLISTQINFPFNWSSAGFFLFFLYYSKLHCLTFELPFIVFFIQYPGGVSICFVYHLSQLVGCSESRDSWVGCGGCFFERWVLVVFCKMCKIYFLFGVKSPQISTPVSSIHLYNLLYFCLTLALPFMITSFLECFRFTEQREKY